MNYSIANDICQIVFVQFILLIFIFLFLFYLIFTVYFLSCS